MERIITQAEAIREAIHQEMERDPRVVVLGQNVDDHKGTYGTTRGLQPRFGEARVFDTPLSEDAVCGAAIGMALGGLRPIHVHIRMDFLMLSMNQLVNIASKARYMYGGQVSVPLVVRSVIGRSWGQGGQHSQGLHALFMHVPGLRVVAPTTPYDAKGLMTASIEDPNPVMFIEHRMVHMQKGHVPPERYTVPFGRARVLAEGDDVTIVAVAHMAVEAMRAAVLLGEVGIRAEVVDPVSLAPLDAEGIAASVEKTRRLLVVDNSWVFCGASAEIVAGTMERLQGRAPFQVRRMGYAPVTCPTTRCLEDRFYPSARTIAETAHELVRGKAWQAEDVAAPEIVQFKGPF